MSGLKYLADTNFFIKLINGNKSLNPFLDANLGLSVVSEIELLGWHNIEPDEIAAFEHILAKCVVFELLPAVKAKAIELKRSK